MERSPNGKVLIPWWGIETPTGHNFRNQPYAQRLLDHIDAKLVELGLGGADHIVDRSWLELCPGLQVYAAHAWFDPWNKPPCAYSVKSHNGVKVGVTVPSFYEIIAPKDGAVLCEALAKFRAEHCDYVLIESGTNFSEAAELMRDSTGNTCQLDIVRAHIQSVQEEDFVDTVAKQPLLAFVVFDALLPGSLPDTYALPWNEAKGEPDPSSDRVFSLQKDGTVQTRSNVLNVEGGIREWESGQIIGDKLVFNTEGAAIKVFGLIRRR